MDDVKIWKVFIILGSLFLVLGLGLYLGQKMNLPFRLGELTGDIKIQSESTKFYFPITSCLLISGILSAISFIIKKF